MAAERRRHERIILPRSTRFISRMDLEANGRLLNISEGGMALAAPTSAQVGDDLIAYPTGLGRIPGVVVRAFEGGVGVRFILSDGQRTNLARRIAAVASDSPYIQLFENRTAQRVAMQLPAHAFVVGDDTAFECEIINLSSTGAAVQSQTRPPIGSQVRIGTLQGRVCRHSGAGFALEFQAKVVRRLIA